MKVLVINAGSSSLKYQLLDPDTKEVLAKGLCERIGIDGHIKHTPTGKDVYDADRYMPDHEAAIKLVMEVLTHNYYGVIQRYVRDRRCGPPRGARRRGVQQVRAYHR